MTRLEHYTDSLKEAHNNPDTIKGVLTILLAEYSKSIISRTGNTRFIMDWLEETENE